MMKQELSNGFTTVETKTWPEYGVKQVGVLYNGKDTGKRHIVYNNNYVNTCSSQYVLLPNEQVIDTVERIIDEHPEYGLVPDNTKSEGTWHKQEGNVIKSKASSIFPAGTSIFAKYTLGEGFDPGDGKTVHMGIGIGNSIDLTRGFSIAPYHQRPWCTNTMIHIAFQSILADGTMGFVKDTINVYEKDITVARGNLSKAFEHVSNVAGANRRRVKAVRHTKKLTDSFIEEQIIHSLDALEVLKQKYTELNNLKMTKYHAQQIVNSMPKTSIKEFDFIKTTEKEVDGNKIVEAELVGSPTQWDGFNALTDYLSHGKLAYNSTMNHFRDVDQIFMKVEAQ